jgi:hypothetical protein
VTYDHDQPATLDLGMMPVLGMALPLPPLPLYSLMWSSSVLMTWYYIGNVMLYRQALLLF